MTIRHAVSRERDGGGGQFPAVRRVENAVGAIGQFLPFRAKDGEVRPRPNGDIFVGCEQERDGHYENVLTGTRSPAALAAVVSVPVFAWTSTLISFNAVARHWNTAA